MKASIPLYYRYRITEVDGAFTSAACLASPDLGISRYRMIAGSESDRRLYCTRSADTICTFDHWHGDSI